MTDPVRWGVLSTARINDAFLAGVAGSREAEVIAVASRDAERGRAYAQRHGIPRAHGSYEALLDDPEVEAVYISLPNGLHLEWSQRALRAGKHVLCEKPLGRDAAAVAAAFDVAQDSDRLLSEGFMYRHHPQTRRLAELVATGAVGTLRMIRSSFSFALADPTDARLSASLQGGALMDVGCYCVSAARLLAGEPESVSAHQVVGGDGVDVSFAGTMAFAGGVLAHFDAGLVLAPRDDLEVVGDRGVLFVEDPWHCREPGIVLRDAEGARVLEVPTADSYRLEAEDFSRAVRDGGAPLLGRDDGVGQARAIEALYAAAASHGAS